ncbi:MAG TPA: aminoglycoside phosphotransferase [Reyranella sp.]|nr:aminoglycoside phosphotransferase [Reyranella sp.]
MTTHALPAAVEADALTMALRTAEVLSEGRVVAVRAVHSFPTVLSQLHRLVLDYEGASDAAPRHLYLKTDLPGRPAAEMDSGRREVAFYTTVAPATPLGLLPRCFDAQVADSGAWHVLLEDLTDSHTIASQWPMPPTVTQTEAIVRCRARFQAAWWDHPRLGADVGAWTSRAEHDRWLADLAKEYEAFADALGDRLPAARRAVYERLFAQAPRLMERGESRRHMTIAQGDGHVWNCFLPRAETAETPRLFDWDGWHLGIGAEDLAYMIAMHWFPEMRRRAEGPLLDAFHDELLAQGVAHYDRRALQDDYRLTVLWLTLRPIWMRALRIPTNLWWHHLERIHLAVDDLDCRALLG